MNPIIATLYPRKAAGFFFWSFQDDPDRKRIQYQWWSAEYYGKARKALGIE